MIPACDRRSLFLQPLQPGDPLAQMFHFRPD